MAPIIYGPDLVETASYDRLDQLFHTRFAEGLTPGMVWGVVDGGRVVHTGALGSTVAGTDPATSPSPDSVFRIASMSKSFTAAAVLLLRDRGLLRLDDPVGQYVPELAGDEHAGITIRTLLTMGAGLLTDDPWGDRQESLSYADFGDMLSGSFTIGRSPNREFEYSNMGYALLGRTIENVAAEAHGWPAAGANRRFVETELLEPLGMTASRYAWNEIGSELVPGHVKRSTGWQQVEPADPGSFSAMGGLHSSVNDLARWVTGFLNAFGEPSPGGSSTDRHPLSAASRREMQQLQRFAHVDAAHDEHGLHAHAVGYGFGLFVQHDSQLGQFVSHSGGYPGYGSRMVWHPGTGLGVITLSNGTYAGAYQQADDALRLLVRDRIATPQPVLAHTLDWVGPITEKLTAFDPETDQPWVDPEQMSPNVDLDTPDAERRDALARARERVGAPQPSGTADVYSRAMAHAAWVVPAERGRYDVEILLTPEARPRLQTLTVTGVPHAPAGAREQLDLALASPAAARLRAFGDPHVVTQPVSANDQNTEFLVRAGGTWWKAIVPAHPASDPSDAPTLTTGEETAGAPNAGVTTRVTFSLHPAAAYPRFTWLARQLDDLT